MSERPCACICKCPKERAPVSWTCLDCREERCPLYPEYVAQRLREVAAVEPVEAVRQRLLDDAAYVMGEADHA